MSIRLSLAKALNLVNKPLVFDHPVIGIVQPVPETVSFTPVESPAQHSVAIIDAASIEDISDVIEEILFLPEIETLFEPLTRPRVAGKRYREIDEVSDGEGIQTVFPIDKDVRCRHGLIQGYCQTCREQRTASSQKRREKEAATVDVFEQLYYILQPPILKPAGQVTIFPNGNHPYNFQVVGVHWLVDKTEALLADEMGLGKTIQAIIAMRVLFRRGELQRALVVCPASLTINWEREFKSWAPELRPTRITGSRDVRSEAWKVPSDVHIVSYETLTRDIAGIPVDQFDLCVLDEVQKIKNRSTANHRVVRRLTSKRRWALSGTPIENSIQDALAIFQILAPTLFSANEVLDTATVRKRIAPYTLRRTIADSGLDDIPSLNHESHWLELTDAQRARYDRTEESGITDIRALGSGATRINVLALISRLKQICNYDEESGESCKLEFLQDSLEGIVANNEKALVFSQYPIKTLKMIEPMLKDFKPLTFDGSLSTRARDDRIKRFQDDEDDQILLISIKAGGTGLTLTRANHVFHFDHWWNPAVVDQGTARIRRIGQKRPIFAHSLYAANTVEERIAEILKEKREIFSQVFGNLNSEIDEEAITRLSDEDLFGLFDLTPPGKEAAKKFADMTPEEFEKAVGTLFKALGYNLSVTQRTHDGGIDLDGYGEALGRGRVVVQCKRYSGTVGVGAVRDLFGVVSADNNITQGFLVTTSTFSKDARDFSRGKRITLINGVELDARFSNLNTER